MIDHARLEGNLIGKKRVTIESRILDSRGLLEQKNSVMDKFLNGSARLEEAVMSTSRSRTPWTAADFLKENTSS